MLKKLKNVKSKVMLVALALVFTVAVFMASAGSVYAYAQDDEIAPAWFIYGQPIYYTIDDYYYINITESELAPHYRKFSTSTGVGKEPVLNEEIYFVYATDNSGEKKLLNVQQPDGMANNPNAEGSVEVEIKKVLDVPANTFLSNDSRPMNQVFDAFKVPDSNITVGYGKILYRSVERTATSFAPYSWQYCELENTILKFGEDLNVQIAIMYEIGESRKKFPWGTETIGHHLVALYQFTTYSSH